MGNHVARAEVEVRAARQTVWRVLTSNGARPEIMFGADVQSDWRVGSRIVWRGQWKGKTFEDHGQVIELVEPSRLVLTHFSPFSGLADRPENYHTLRFSLDETPSGTHVTLEQDNNPTPEAAEHARANWTTMLEGVKAVAERAG